MIAHVAACTGWTWDYIAENVDLPRLDALNVYWKSFPPLHVMVAAYFGIKPDTGTASKEQDFDDLFSNFPMVEGPLI